MMGEFGGDMWMTSYRTTPALRELNLVYHPWRQQPHLFLTLNQLSHLKPVHIHLTTQFNWRQLLPPQVLCCVDHPALTDLLRDWLKRCDWNIINELLLLLLLLTDCLFSLWTQYGLNEYLVLGPLKWRLVSTDYLFYFAYERVTCFLNKSPGGGVIVSWCHDILYELSPRNLQQSHSEPCAFIVNTILLLTRHLVCVFNSLFYEPENITIVSFPLTEFAKKIFRTQYSCGIIHPQEVWRSRNDKEKNQG